MGDVLVELAVSFGSWKAGNHHAGPVMPWFVPVTTADRWLTWMKWYDSVVLSRCHAWREGRFQPVRFVKNEKY